MGEYLDKEGLTRFKEKMLTEVEELVGASGGGTVTSVDGKTGAVDLSDTYQPKGDYLPLSGGTMTNTITFSAPIAIQQSTATSYTTIRGGTTNSDGARLVLCSKGDSDVGQFKLYANDGTNSKSLVGKPDGTLAWGGGTVAHIKNGSFEYGQIEYNGNKDVDLNALVESGVYSVVASSSANATTYNYPSGGGTNGFLEVYRTASGHVRQKYYRIGTVNSNDYNVFTRTINLNSSTYGSWQRNAILVTSWQSGANWYRKWSDGWIEQGGRITFPNNNKYTLTLNTAFSNTNFVAIFQPTSYTDKEAWNTPISPVSRTTSTVTINSKDNWSGYGIDWYACGK